MGEGACEKCSFPEPPTQVLRDTQRTGLERHLFEAMKESTGKGKKKKTCQGVRLSTDAREAFREDPERVERQVRKKWK